MGNLRIPVGLDISDADAAVGDVKDPKTFYAGAVPKKTGTMPTVAIVAGSNAYPAGYHAGDGGGLDAVDTDLAVGNIKKDVVIFGLTGTYEETLAEDVEGETKSGLTTDAAGGANTRKLSAVGGLSELSIVLKNLTFDANSLTFAAAFACCGSESNATMKMRLYMGGVQMQESGFIEGIFLTTIVLLRDFKALSGSQDCELKAYNTIASSRDFSLYAGNNSLGAGAIAVGSVKLT